MMCCHESRMGVGLLAMALGWVGAGPAVRALDPPPPPEPPKQERKEDELSRKLLRKAQNAGDEDVMDSIMRLMGEAASNMEVKLDPGTKTQELHKQILDKLDEAIKAAASRRRPMRPPESKQQDRRRRGSDKTAQRLQQGGPQKRAQSSDNEEPTKGAAAKPVELPDGELIDVRRAWGHLPQRDREEIIQGVSEEFLEKYREWVERYYRALQESSGEPK